MLDLFARGRRGHRDIRALLNRRGLAALVLLASVVAGPNGLMAPAPAAAAGGPPAAASSYYMRTVKQHRLYRMGCGFGRGVVHGKQPMDGLVVLAFGSPRHRHNRFGTSLFGHGFASTTQVRSAGVRFALGYAHCTRKRPKAALRIALGTSNYGHMVGYNHGRAWAGMVNAANDRLGQLGLSSRVEITGANDIEPGWAGPKATRAWVRGYDSKNRWPYYNFGGAAACPPYGNCAGAWTLEDVWYVSWGAAPALPLPEIYTKSGASARQWFHVTLYSATRHRSPMTISGVMSQHRACHQMPDPCRGMNNSPPRAWKQLSRLLNADRRTARRVRWATDIAWSRTR